MDPTDIWPRGKLIATDLLETVLANRHTSDEMTAPPRQTLCGVTQARWATEIGFAIHESSLRHKGGRVELPVAGRAEGVRVDSRAWGNLLDARDCN